MEFLVIGSSQHLNLPAELCDRAGRKKALVKHAFPPRLKSYQDGCSIRMFDLETHACAWLVWQSTPL